LEREYVSRYARSRKNLLPEQHEMDYVQKGESELPIVLYALVHHVLVVHHLIMPHVLTESAIHNSMVTFVNALKTIYMLQQHIPETHKGYLCILSLMSCLITVIR
jgi:hypothetical protein